jgi:hypothetical protein
MTTARILALAVVAVVGVVFMAFGGALFVGQDNGRAGNALLFLLGAMVVATVVVAAMYGAA